MPSSGVIFFLLLTAGCSPPASDGSSPSSAELTVGFAGANVAGRTFGVRVFTTFLTLEGLGYPAPDGRTVPRLAESWHWENDGLVLRVKLRPGVTFHDGTPLTAAVATDILRRAVGDAANLALYPSFSDVVSIEPTNRSELVIQLARRSAFLPDDLTFQFEHGARNVGTGPYRVAKGDGSALVFERYGPYYRGEPSITRVVVKPFETLRTAWSSLLRGEVDMVSEVPPDSVEFVQSSNVQIISMPTGYQYLIAFNSKRAPFASASVRRALNMAIDRDALVRRVFQGYALPSTGPIWPKHWAYDATVKPFPFDPRAAGALLDAAGFKEGQQPATTRRAPARLRFTCLLASSFGVVERVALEVQKQLYDVGVDMEFEIAPPADLDKRIRSGEFDAVLTDMISGPTLSRTYLFWRSAKQSKGLNVFGYENATTEQQFEALRSSTNEAATRSATQRLQAAFGEDPPALFLAWSQRVRAIKRDFKVVRDPETDPMLTLWRWTADKTGRESRASLAQ